MITLTRPSFYDRQTVPSFAGRSIDEKPVDVANGAEYTEIDTGRIYRFDAENAVWHEAPRGGVR